MAKKIAKAAPEAPKTEAKNVGKPQMADEAKKAKRLARLEALKNRPEGQRTNSKQVDVIELENGSKVMSFGYPIRKVGTLVTSVVFNEAGEAISVSTTLIPGTKVRARKGHGTIIPGTLGAPKGNDLEEDDEDSEDED